MINLSIITIYKTIKTKFFFAFFWNSEFPTPAKNLTTVKNIPSTYMGSIWNPNCGNMKQLEIIRENREENGI